MQHLERSGLEAPLLNPHRSTIMSNVPAFRRCAECDQVITRNPVVVNIYPAPIRHAWYCRHCAKMLDLGTAE